MRSARRSFESGPRALLAALAAGLALTACAKGPAAEALKAADASVASASADGQKFAPEQLKALMEAAKSAHDEFDDGDYARAKTAAEAVVTEAQSVLKAAAAKKEEVTRTWADLQARVPAMGDAIRKKLDELASMKRLPKGFDKARLDQAKAGVTEFDQAWMEAGAAAQSGDLVSAAEKARAADAKAQELTASLGLPSPTAGSAAANK